MIIKRLKENAEDYLEQEIKKVVGFEILKIINKTKAAALAYKLKEKNDLLKSEEDKEKNIEKEIIENKIYFNFWFRGKILDVTSLTYDRDKYGHEFEVKGHSSNTLLGDDDFDNRLIDYFIQKFEKENNNKIDKDSISGKFALKRLKNSCEEAKKILSTQDKYRICIESLYRNDDLNLQRDRKDFWCLYKDYFNELIKSIELALKISGFSKYDINEVLLVGESTRIQKIKSIILEYFGKKVKINDSINPDEVVAYGATLQAAICMKEKSLNDVMIYDICSHSLGTDIIGNDQGPF